MSLTHAASDLVHCQHPSRVRVVTGQRAEWCERCGAIFDGTSWERPSLHTEIRSAVKASARPARTGLVGGHKRARKTAHRVHRMGASKKRSPRTGRSTGDR